MFAFTDVLCQGNQKLSDVLEIFSLQIIDQKQFNSIQFCKLFLIEKLHVM